MKYEGIWGELKAKNCFPRKSFTKYLRQTLRDHYGKISIKSFKISIRCKKVQLYFNFFD